ncbi:MAG: hypothetical protein KAK01_03410 [Candidatus Marinimicrobia bacterium]|nr:hypothetical protein [Candidatus Neomarinimicrobiota bacterium]
MNTKIPVKLMISFLLMMFVNNVSAQTSFGVRVGGPTQSYYLGIMDFGFIKPIFGLDYYEGTINIEMDYHYEEYDGGNTYTDDDELTVKGSLRLFMPRAGLKFFQQQKKDLRSYILTEAFMVVPIVNFESKVDGETDELKDKDKDRIKDAVDYMGLTIGVGTEYYFSDQFSIGGEAGFNMLLWNWSDEYSDSEDDYYYSWSEEYKFDVKARLSGSYGRMSINFYF